MHLLEQRKFELMAELHEAGILDRLKGFLGRGKEAAKGMMPKTKKPPRRRPQFDLRKAQDAMKKKAEADPKSIKAVIGDIAAAQTRAAGGPKQHQQSTFQQIYAKELGDYRKKPLKIRWY